MEHQYETIRFLGQGGQGAVEALFRAVIDVTTEEGKKYAQAEAEYLQTYEQEYFPSSCGTTANVGGLAERSPEEYRKEVALNNAKGKFCSYYIIFELARPLITIYLRNYDADGIPYETQDQESAQCASSSKADSSQGSFGIPNRRGLPLWFLKKFVPVHYHYLKIMDGDEFPTVPRELLLNVLKGTTSFSEEMGYPTAKKIIECTSIAIRKRAEREVEALRLLAHRNIVAYNSHSWDPVNNITIIHMELCGPSLRHFISDKRYVFDEKVQISWSCDMVRAGAYLHHENIVHRDIKPDNFFVMNTAPNLGLLKLGDFGNANILRIGHRIAKAYEFDTVSNDVDAFEQEDNANDFSSTSTDGSMLMTRWYIAPELEWHPDWFMPESDLYSVGITTWELITRRSVCEFDREELRNIMEPLLLHVHNCTAPLEERIGVEDALEFLLKWKHKVTRGEPVNFEAFFDQVPKSSQSQSVDQLKSDLMDLHFSGTESSAQTSISASSSMEQYAFASYQVPLDNQNSTQSSSAFTGETESTHSAKLDERLFKLAQSIVSQKNGLPEFAHHSKFKEGRELPNVPTQSFTYVPRESFFTAWKTPVSFSEDLGFPTTKKVIECSSTADRRRAEREVEALRALTYGIENDERYAFEEKVKVSWSYDMVRAVAFMKQENIMHRDIKPENFLLLHTGPNRGSLKLCNFGSAYFLRFDCLRKNEYVFEDNNGSNSGEHVRQKAHSNLPQSFDGPLISTTLLYVAPESRENLNAFISECDLYSVAITTWELITRRHVSSFNREDLSDATDPLLRHVYKSTAPLPHRYYVEAALESLTALKQEITNGEPVNFDRIFSEAMNDPALSV